MITRDKKLVPLPPARCANGRAKYAILAELALNESFVVESPKHILSERNLIHVTANRMGRAVAIRSITPTTIRVWRIK